MVSFIIVAREKTKRQTYAQNYAKKHEINSFDITVIEKESSKKNLQSIGIEDIKNILEKIFLKPIKSKNKLIIIEDAQLLTPEAQNALLKVLEEPPANTIIMLGTATTEALLPTIQSRCQIIVLEEEKRKISEQTISELNSFIESLPQLTIGEKLKHAEQLAKDKDKALEWIENLILILRGKLIEVVIRESETTLSEPEPRSRRPESDSGQARKTDLKLVTILKSFQKLHTILKTTNVNPRFAIEHILLSL